MAEYRRFVAYVYEYQKERKGDNCGFVKVEVKGSLCKIELHLRCPGLIPETECKVYGFVRNKELIEGVLLGTCTTSEGKAECILETYAEHMGDSEKALNEMGGMIFVTEQGGFWGTEWDDQPIRPEKFQMAEKPQQELHAQSVKETEKPTCAERTEKTELNVRTLPGTPYDAFADGELSECRKISIQDLCRLGRRVCMLHNNRFVQYGFYNFGHLLFCRNSCGQRIIGVPGGYDQQERFMANMFGFPYFKESGYTQIPEGKGGYWYRLIDSADPDNRNGC